MAKERGLTNKQKQFVQEYFVDLNAYQAALRAGYSVSKAKKACEFFTHPLMKKSIDAAFEKRKQRTDITQEKVLQELAKVAFSDFSQLATWTNDTLTLKPSDTLTPEQTSIIKEIANTATTKSSKTKIKLHDKMKALELIGRHLGMFNDKLSLSGGVDISLLERARERVKMTENNNETQLASDR